MTFATLHDLYREATAARNIARALNHHDVMDMTLVARAGCMRVTSTPPAGRTGTLIRWKVLDHVQHLEQWVLIKGPRFDAVCKASQDIANAQDRGMVL